MENPTQPSAQNDPAVVKYDGPTPGPWEVYTFVGPLMIRNKEREEIIAHVGHMNFQTCAANAELIAAAPDMLATLQHIDKHDYVTFADFDRVRAVIAKATGAA